MVLKLYGAIYTVATQRVVLVLKTLDAPFELIPVDLTKGEHKSNEYVAKQPVGLVPFMVRLSS
jgi:glutathione S-transferase